MNKKQKLAIIILSIFLLGMVIGAADAAHTVKKGKYKAKLSKKEYKKLTKTKTKYKTVTKTRTVEKTRPVTKSKTVKKNRTVTKYKEEIRQNKTITYKRELKNNIKNVTRTLYYERTYKNGTKVNGTEDGDVTHAMLFEKLSNGENRYSTENGTYYNISKTYTRTDYTNHYYKSYNVDLKEYYLNEIVTIKNYTVKVPYNDTEEYDETEKYTVNEKYNTTEKYTMKVPYKVRINAEVQKTVGYKKVKLDRVVGHKYKTVYKYKTVKLKQAVYNAKSDTYTSYRGTHQKYKYKDWKLVKTITKYKSDGSYIEYDVIKSKKKVAVKQKISIIKAVKTKKPILMNIRTTNSANRLLKGKKVYVEIYCNGNLLKKGTANIK